MAGVDVFSTKHSISIRSRLRVYKLNSDTSLKLIRCEHLHPKSQGWNAVVVNNSLIKIMFFIFFKVQR